MCSQQQANGQIFIFQMTSKKTFSLKTVNFNIFHFLDFSEKDCIKREHYEILASYIIKPYNKCHIMQYKMPFCVMTLLKNGHKQICQSQQITTKQPPSTFFSMGEILLYTSGYSTPICLLRMKKQPQKIGAVQIICKGYKKSNPEKYLVFWK